MQQKKWSKKIPVCNSWCNNHLSWPTPAFALTSIPWFCHFCAEISNLTNLLHNLLIYTNVFLIVCEICFFFLPVSTWLPDCCLLCSKLSTAYSCLQTTLRFRADVPNAEINEGFISLPLFPSVHFNTHATHNYSKKLHKWHVHGHVVLLMPGLTEQSQPQC